MLDKTVDTKTLEWDYEREYRLTISLGPGEDCDGSLYRPEELSEWFLGANGHRSQTRNHRPCSD